MDTKLTNNIKLEEISTQYSKFDKNQVLTETQLNGFLDYFDDQHRLSRTSLSGVGIVCGFKLGYTLQEVQIKGETKREFRLKVTQGRGVTTDGDLLALQNELPIIEGRDNEVLKTINFSAKTYGYCKTYIDDNAKYEHFLEEGEDEKKRQIPLWELYETQDGNDSLTKIQDLPNIEEMVVLLYLENYSKDGGLCTKLSCDNQGIAQVAKLKVLLVSLGDAEYIVSKDTIYRQHNWYETYTSLPEVQARRVVLNCENTKTFVELKKNYHEAINKDNTIGELNDGYDRIFRRFKQSSLRRKINQLFSFTENSVPMDFQYRYDLLKDLIDTYNEIKGLLLHLNVDCCPEIGSFPKHLMLGKIKEEEDYANFRHQFYKSPIIGHDNENYLKVISLIKRAKALVYGYRGFHGNTIKITPSKACAELQYKAIPFYYNVDESLLTQWSFSKTSNLKQKFNLSYHTRNLASVPPIQRPLEYSLDCFNFYRIEGHQGKVYREALEKIFKIREDQGLNFDVKALSINISNKEIDIHKYRCQFEDLSLLLNAWKAEQNCILTEVSKFLSAFSTEEAGRHFSGSVHDVDKYKDIAAATGYDVMMGPAIGMVDGAKDTGDLMREMEEMRKKYEEGKEMMIDPATGMVDGAKDTGDLMREMEEMRKKYEGGKEMMMGYLTMVEYTSQKDVLGKNAIKEGLANQQGSVGEILNKSFADNEYGSQNDILAHFNESIKDLKETQVWLDESELGAFVFNDIPEVLVNAYVLDDKVPDSILTFDDRTLKEYQHTIETLCILVKKLQAKYQTLNIDQDTKQIIALLINQLSTVCCSGKKLELLQSEIIKRRDQILIQIQLSEFVKKHPGLEHKAGVKPGGTFVMVYLTENERDEPVYERKTLEIEFTEQPIIDEKGLTGDEGYLNLWDERVSTRFVFMRNVSNESKNSFEEIVSIGKSIDETVSNFAAFLNQKWKQSGAKNIKALAEDNRIIIGIQDRSIPEEAYYVKFGSDKIIGKETVRFFEKNTLIQSRVDIKNKVVADFCLPFMFKSDCAPINFIIPKEPVVLKLPQPFVCLKEEGAFEPMVFEKSPANLEIKAKVPEGIESGLTKNENGEDVFDARLTDESLYRKEIEFTLGGEKTDCVVTVYPDVDLSVTTDVSYNNAKTVATVIYEVSEVMPNLIYAWDFVKGGISDQKPGQDGKITKKYDLPVNDANQIEPKLIISNGFCEREVAIEPIVFESPISVSLGIAEKYCLDTQKDEKVRIPFTNKEPSQGIIEIVDGTLEGLEIENDELVINPAEFREFDREIRFTIDKISTNARITICELMQVTIVEDPAGFKWIDGVLHRGYYLGSRIPDEVNEEELTYLWTVNGEEEGIGNSIRPDLLVAKGTNTYNVEVKITDRNDCVATQKTTVNIDYPSFRLFMPNNKLDYCLNDNDPRLVTVDPDIFGTVVDGLGMSVDAAGKNQFTPSATNLASVGTIPLGIAGETLLTLTLKDVPKASFTSKIENGELILTNTSDDADTYVWNVEGETITRTKRTEIKRTIDSFQSSQIKVLLVAIGPCGQEEVPFEKIIKLRDESDQSNSRCIDAIRGYIKKDRTKLSDNIDVDQDTLKNIVTPTISVYDSIANGPDDVFQGLGNLNALRSVMKLFTQTEKYLIQNKQNSYVFSELSKFYIAQAKLVFNILHCQPHATLEKDKELITMTVNSMTQSFENLNKENLVFDFENDLKTYLNGYSSNGTIIPFLQEAIKKELIPVIA